MGRSVKADYRAIIESTLASHPNGLPLDELLERSGLKVDRSTLFRHLTRLIETGRTERIGDARASRYRLLVAAPDRAPLTLDAAPIRAPLAPPDTQRAGPESIQVEALEYDAVVKKAVRTIVREWKRCNRVNLEIYLSLLVEPKHLNKVAAAVEKELRQLHEGDLDRFGLSQAEFGAFIPLASREAAGN